MRPTRPNLTRVGARFALAATAALVALVLVLPGCGGAADPPPDAGVPRDAGGMPVDAPVDPGLDAGTPADDAGGGEIDAPVPGVDAPPAMGTDAGPMSGGPGPDEVGPFAVVMSSTAVTGATYVTFLPTLPAGTRAPLVLMKHGFQLATSNYAQLCGRVASHGFVVVGVDTAGGLFGGPTNVDERDATIAALTWATTAAPFAASVDGDRVLVMGHSRGGKVSVMVAAADARIDAALLLDPVNGCGPGSPFSATCPDVTTGAFAGSLAMPVGVMGETNNATGGFMPCAPAAQNYDTIYDAIPTATSAVEWTFTGADHMDFTDDGGGVTGSFCTDGPGDDVQIRAAVRTLAVAFARRHLRDEVAMDAWLTGASVPAGITHEGP